MGGTKKLSGEGNVELGTIEFPSLNLRINWESLPKLQRFGPPPPSLNQEILQVCIIYFEYNNSRLYCCE